MPLEMVTSAKALSAQLALVRFLPRVCPYVLAKVFLGEKLLTTVVTPVMMWVRNDVR